MSLKERIEARRRRPNTGGVDWSALYDAFVQSLATSGIVEASLKARDRAPDFMLPDSDGTLVASRELLEQGPLVVSFFRGDWCPYCNLELEALQEVLPEIEAAGANLVALTPDTGAAFQSPKKRHGLGYRVLSDADNGVALEFGVVFRVSDAVRAAYVANGIDLGARHGNVNWFLPIPATYIIDRDGTIRHAEIDPDFRHRMEPADIAALLRQIAEEGSGGRQ
jgi:peroxiredoxin